MKTQTRYKFLKVGMMSAHGNMKWRLNKWYKYEGDIALCESGFHCSKGIYQAFSYVQGPILALVEVRGEHGDEKDKEVWSEMRVVKRWKWTKRDSVLFSIYSAKLVLKNFESVFPSDKRPREAIEAAEVYIKNPSVENASAASAAASAAESARSAAASAVWSAASAAASAESAASAAASAAESAARSAESKIYKKLDVWMIKHLPELKEI